jgi:hypothetical protein
MSEDWLAVVIAFGVIVLAAIAAAGSNSELQGLCTRAANRRFVGAPKVSSSMPPIAPLAP